MIRLRGHHLICLHFFQGEGYSPQFVDNLKRIIKKASSGAQIAVTEDADDVCAACPHIADGQCAHKSDSEKTIRLLDEMALELLGVEPCQKVTWKQIKDLTMAIPDYMLSEFCRDCDWEKLCRKISA